MSMQSPVAVVASALVALAGPYTWAAATVEPLQEVTVTAHRAELAKRVSKFVDQIAASENGQEGLARWQRPPACPLVSGLPQSDGEFILERLSQIAQDATVPLGGEQCSANLYVLVTDKPEELLRGMEQRNRRFAFGFDTSFYPPQETSAAVVDEFIKTPRAVRVWYNSAEKDAWGNALALCRESDLKPDGDPTRQLQCGPGTPGGSHLVFDTIWTLSRVFVIVDQTQLHHVTLAQLADYVAMAGFAKLKPDAPLGDAPTILSLFNGTSESAPAGLTEWDQTFLKSLYTTEQKSQTQRSQIAHQMVRDIAPLPAEVGSAHSH